MSDTTPDAQVTWEAPKNVRRARRDWEPTATSLKERKGEWAKLDGDTTSPGLAYHIKKGQLKDFRPAGAFEARSTKNEDGTYDIFARYVGVGVGTGDDQSSVSDFLN